MKEILINLTNIPERLIVPEASFLDDLGCDSLDMVELAMAIDDEFKVELSDNDFEKIHTFDQAVEHIKSKLNRGT